METPQIKGKPPKGLVPAKMRKSVHQTAGQAGNFHGSRFELQQKTRRGDLFPKDFRMDYQPESDSQCRSRRKAQEIIVRMDSERSNPYI